jgi:MerC mercury resistance protein
MRHRDPLPLQVGAGGIALMTVALFVGHGKAEAVLTISGVALLGWAHLRNLRHSM